MLISGKRDQLWPSTCMCEQMMGRLDSESFAHCRKHLAYDTGHAGMIRDRACWREVFGFLKEHFG